MALSPLLPERHPQKDFFIADIFDSLPFKDDMATMEHPLFTLSTKPDQRELNYASKGVSIQIQPSYHGLPTIFDKDVLLYCGSQLMERINLGDAMPPKKMRISLHDLLMVTNRKTNGEGYRLIKKSINRLTGSMIKTNIETGNTKQESMFHILESAEFVESKRIEGRLVAMEITLSDWFYNSLIAKQVLTIAPEYFRLRKSIDRRLYEIARKHCGNNKYQWSLNLDTLHSKTGSRDVLAKFRAAVKLLEKENHLPEYKVTYNRDLDSVTFTNRKLEDNKAKQAELDLPPGEVPPDLVEEVRAIDAKLDVYSLWAEWHEWNQGNGNKLKDWRLAFLGFCRKKLHT